MTLIGDRHRGAIDKPCPYVPLGELNQQHVSEYNVPTTTSPDLFPVDGVVHRNIELFFVHFFVSLYPLKRLGCSWNLAKNTRVQKDSIVTSRKLQFLVEYLGAVHDAKADTRLKCMAAKADSPLHLHSSVRDRLSRPKATPIDLTLSDLLSWFCVHQ